MRRYLLARDGPACRRCGDPIEHETPSLGHIIAIAEGGTDSPGNLGLEHLRCNQSAGAHRDRAILIRASRAAEAVSLLGGTRRTEPTAARNGARNGKPTGTIIRIALDRGRS
jgi:hypothetical protein